MPMVVQSLDHHQHFPLFLPMVVQKMDHHRHPVFKMNYFLDNKRTFSAGKQYLRIG